MFMVSANHHRHHPAVFVFTGAVSADVDAMALPSAHLPSVQMYTAKMAKLRLAHGNNRSNRPIANLPFLLDTCASSSAPNSSSDLIGSYSDDVNKFVNNDEYRIPNNGSHGATNGREHRSSLDLECLPQHKKDPLRSVNGSLTGRGLLERDRDSRDRHKDEGILPPAHKQNYFRPLGVRNTFLSGQAITPSNGNSQQQAAPQLRNGTLANLGREPDDLVAMGTNWNPATPHQRLNGRPGSLSGMATNPAQAHSLPQHQQPLPPPPPPPSSQQPSSLGSNGRTAAPTHGATMKFNPKANVLGGLNAAVAKQARESDTRYVDPLHGASPTFHLRVSELAALESETIRWEKSRKVKKKTA